MIQANNALNVPTIASAAHSHSYYDVGQMYQQAANAANQAVLGQIPVSAHGLVAAHKLKELIMSKSARRLVQVVIVDPDENVPLADCMLFKGEEKLTDATDQELFFELDIKDILDKHNAKRTTLIDKKVKDRTEYLQPAKIRDLKMVVVNIATF